MSTTTKTHSMKKTATLSAAVAALALTFPVLAMSGDKELPPGPIHDRYELMETIGDNAKTIGDALKAGNTEPVAGAAETIKAEAAKALPLFPKGSTHANSRALPEIWEDWAKFEASMKDLETKAGELAAAARSGGDVGAAAKAMFGNCKSCHDDFRKPEEKKEG